MPRFVHFAHKESLQILRDISALALLFIMPVVFLLIMSLALQSRLESHKVARLEYYLVDKAGSTTSSAFIEMLDESGSFSRKPEVLPEAEARKRVQRDDAKFLLLVPENFDRLLVDQQTAVRIEIAPGTEPSIAMLFESRVREALSTMYLERTLEPILSETDLDIDADKIKALLEVESLFEGKSGREVPTSVQQGVPAWLVFAMFFVSVPLSTTLVGERENGTLARLRTMSLPQWQILLGKFIPYFVINLCQVVLMVLAGMYVVPLLGGDRLLLGDAYVGLALISVASSLAAVSFGLFMAQWARTNEQATILAGVTNLIMAAIGGVMVPRFLMPQLMQDFSWISPMTWGLEGYLDLLLRGGTVTDVLFESAGLAIFACIMWGLALSISARRRII